MNILRLLPVILSLLVLGAHYFRSGIYLVVALILGLLGLLFVKKAWVARLTQFVLVLGTLEWIRTLFELVAVRQAFSQPWSRMAVILGSVALLTGASALVFRSSALKERYSLTKKE
jgi:hypothetical protein